MWCFLLLDNRGIDADVYVVCMYNIQMICGTCWILSELETKTSTMMALMVASHKLTMLRTHCIFFVVSGLIAAHSRSHRY